MTPKNKILITVMCIYVLFSCRTIKHSVTTDNVQSASYTQIDSTVIREREKIGVVKIPAATASLFISPQALLQLPPEAIFAQQSGRASVAVSRDSLGNIQVQAHCDSLEVYYTSLYAEYMQFKTVATDSISRLQARIETVKELSSWDVFWVKFGRVCAGIIVLTAAFLLFKWKLKF